jgi:hypothetical protein
MDSWLVKADIRALDIASVAWLIMRLVLVDQRGPLAVAAHARHQILDPRAASSGEGVAGMPQVMDVQAA